MPQLRFSGFDGDWEVKRLGEVSEIDNNNLNSKTSKEYKFSYISLSDVKEGSIKNQLACYAFKDAPSRARKIVKKGSVLLATVRPNLKAFAYVHKEVDNLIASTGFALIEEKGQANTEFIYHNLYTNYITHQIYTLVVGSNYPAINSSDVKNLKIAFPSLPEQQKIANFLSSIEKQINLLEQKTEQLEAFKKGTMQQLFSQKVRFKDKNGEDFPAWETKYLGEVFDRVRDKNKEDNQNVLTISGQLGLISQLKYFTRPVSSKNLTGYYLLKKGDFAYNKSYSNGYPMGAIKRLTRYDKGVVSTLYICFRNKDERSSDFYEHFFLHSEINKELYKIAQEGARNHGLLNVSVVDFFEAIKIPLPSLPEQKKIADCLNSIDQQIQGVRTQLEASKAYKKGLLQQLLV